MKKKTLHMHGIVTVAVAAAVLLSMASCNKKNQGVANMTPEIATITVKETSANLDRGYAATIKGKVDVDVRPMVSGFITAVHVDEGQHVSKGQPLFTLDQVQYQAAVDQANAAVAAANATYQSAALQAEGNRKLFEKNIISQMAYDMSEQQLAQAKSALAQAQAALANAQKNLSYTVVTAPVAGFVGSIPNREGTLASPSMATPLTTISDNDEVYAYFALNEKDILEMTRGGEVSLNQAVAAMPDVKLQLADGSIYPETGKIATVTGNISSATGTANLRARFKNINGMLRSGSTGQVMIPHEMTNVIEVPQKATFEVQDHRFIYVVNDSNRINGVGIQVAPYSDGKTFFVTSGLKPGDRVAVEGVGTKLREGMTIKPVETPQN